MQQMRVRQHSDAKYERQADLREEITHHRVLRSEPGTREHAARFSSLARAQEVEARDRLAHQSDRAPPVLAAAGRERSLAQIFLALYDLLKAPLGRSIRAQHLPHCEKHHDYSERCQQDDGVVEPHPGRQPIGNLKIREASAPHISNRAIFIMMKTPVPSIANPKPSRSSPRTSLTRGVR